MPVVSSPKLLLARGQARGLVEAMRQRENSRTTERDIVGHKDDPLGLLTRKMRRVPTSDAPAPATNGSTGVFRISNSGGSKGSAAQSPSGKQKASGKAQKSKNFPHRTKRPHVDFTAPVARRERATTPDGRTSFHFSVEAISRTSRTTQTERGTVVRPGSPAAHDEYIGRDAAVALMQPDEKLQPIQEMELAQETPTNDGQSENGAARDESQLEQRGSDNAVDSFDEKEQPIPRTANDRSQSRTREWGQRADSHSELLAGDGPGDGSVLSAIWDGQARPGTAANPLQVGWTTGRVYQSVLALQSSAGDDADEHDARSGASLLQLPIGDLVQRARGQGDHSMLLHFDEDIDLGSGASGDLRVRRERGGKREARGTNDGRVERIDIGFGILQPAIRPSLTQSGVQILVPGDGLPWQIDLGDRADSSIDAAGHNRYIERPAALAKLADGSHIVFTNMPRDPRERADLWNRIEGSERLPGPDMLTLGPTAGSDYWRAIATKPDCPVEVRLALATADEEKPIRLETETGKATAAWLAAQPGWNKDEPQAVLAPGRGGRTQYRVIGELPIEIDVAARARILKDFAEPFEKRNLPYVAVMHAPDHTNDNRNWHFHLIYYDRPVAKMADGQWDFEVVEKVRDHNKHYREVYRHRQPKDRDVAALGWTRTMRDRLAELSNRELAAAGVTRRLDSRKYEEMGIGRKPMEHLGTKNAALEAMGVQTAVGDANAEKDWEAALGTAARRREYTLIAAARDETTLKRQHGIADNRSPANADRAAHVVRWRQSRDEAAEYTYMADVIETLDARSRSRGERVVELADKRLAAIAAGSARAAEARQRDAIAFRRLEALEHLRQNKIFMADKLAQATEWRRLAAAEQTSALQIEALLRQAAPQLAATPRAVAIPPQQGLPLDGASSGSAAPARARYLDRLEIDAIVDFARQSRVRIIERSGIAYMGTAAEFDRSVEAAGNWAVVSKRLGGIKRGQDQIISDVADYIDKTPGSISQILAPDGQTRMAFYAPRPQWRTAYDDYRDDPALVNASALALVRNAATASRSAATAPREVAVPVAPTTLSPAVESRAPLGARADSLPITAAAPAVKSTTAIVEKASAGSPTSPSGVVLSGSKDSTIDDNKIAGAAATLPITPATPPAAIPVNRATPDQAGTKGTAVENSKASPDSTVAPTSNALGSRGANVRPAADTVLTSEQNRRRIAVAIESLTRGGVRIVDGDEGLTITPAALARMKIEHRDLLQQGAQERLEKIREGHELELARLQAWIAANPDRTVVERGYLILTGEGIPEAVYLASRRWATDPFTVDAAQQTISPTKDYAKSPDYAPDSKPNGLGTRDTAEKWTTMSTPDLLSDKASPRDIRPNLPRYQSKEGQEW